MKLSDVMGAMRLATYAEVALVIFFIVFVVVATELVLGRRSPRWEQASRLPLDDSECDCDACGADARGEKDG
jgi:hypothetical protein